MGAHETIIVTSQTWSLALEGASLDGIEPLPARGRWAADSPVADTEVSEHASSATSPDEFADEPDLPHGDDEACADPSEDDGSACVADPATGTSDATPAANDAALAALVQRIVHQDQAALAELYRRLANRVYRQATRLVRDIGTAEEVVEDVFWQVWRQAPRFDATRGTALMWVQRIARSRAIDALRARGRHPLFAGLDVEHDTEAADDADPQLLLDRAQIGARVQKALAVLDPLRRQLVSLAYERGYSQAEIAAHTGLPLGTVKSHIRRGLAMMKTALESAIVAAPERRP